MTEDEIALNIGRMVIGQWLDQKEMRRILAEQEAKIKELEAAAVAERN